MQKSILYIGIVLTLLTALYRCNLLQRPIVGIELGKSGFHRDLLYTVQFDYPLAGKECEYIIEQPLPAAVYVSVDQLDDLKRLKKLNAIYPGFVDVEVSTEKAEPFTVLLRETPKTTDTIKLPIHFRYHAAAEDRSFVIVTIATPIMYMNCPDNDNDLIDNELEATPSVRYCLLENSSKFVKYNDDVNFDMTIASGDCDWKLINADFKLKTALSAKIPIGEKKSYPPILYVTIILSWIVSIWTVFRTNVVPRRINQKLEEQRILQKKIN